jgi:hypothetical protein
MTETAGTQPAVFFCAVVCIQKRVVRYDRSGRHPPVSLGNAAVRCSRGNAVQPLCAMLHPGVLHFGNVSFKALRPVIRLVCQCEAWVGGDEAR